jgi:serine protease Do
LEADFSPRFADTEGVRLGFVHLSGPRRGAAESFDGPVVQIGTAAGAEVRLDGVPGVAPVHAQLVAEGGRVRLLPRAPLRLNSAPSGGAPLRDGDVLELGGVALRFRIEGGRRGPRPLAARGAVAAALLAAGISGFLALRVREAERERRAASAEHTSGIAELRRALEAVRAEAASRDAFAARALERAKAEVESSLLSKLGAEVERSVERSPGLLAAVEAARRAEASDGAVGEVIRRRGMGVCVIQGAYGFAREIGGEWRFLREARPASDAEREKMPLTLEGDGEIFRVDYTGTGFLADASGLVLTSRHIAEPWWKSEGSAPLIEAGYEPRLLLLRAFFPGRAEPVRFALERSRVSEEADLALLAFEPSGPLPEPLPLAADGAAALGQRVVLLGYPSGLSALLAKSEEDLSDPSTLETIDPVRLLDDLAARGLVRPLPTQGHIGDVLPAKVLYDAATAVGASGGPVLDLQGRVVAINYGLLKSFRAANFGVPVRFARALLQSAPVSSRSTESRSTPTK